MARLLAVEWDAHEAHVVVGNRRGREITLEHAFEVELQPRDPGLTFADTSVGERIGAALTARDIGRCDAIVSVGRASIELRVLSLPPAPAAELPELVRFQAMRQFTTLGEDWPLDFAMLSVGDDESLNILAAAIDPDVVRQITDTCQAGQIAPRQMALRPFAAASLLQRQLPSSNCRLMVDILTDEADLTVMMDDRVVFLRTVRLPVRHDGEATDAFATALLREMRRTMAAAQNQLGGDSLQEVVICGDASEHNELRELIHTELSLPAQVFDPFGGVTLTRELKQNRPDAPGRFAPLIGLLLDETVGNPPAIDFLNPRRRVRGIENLRRNILAGAAVAALILFFAFLGWNRFSSMSRELAELKKKSSGLDALVSTSEQKIKEAQLIDRFTNADVTWLDELYEISSEFPDGEKAIASQVIFNAGVAEGGQIHLKGFTDEHSTIEELERSLRDERHRIYGKGGSEDPNRRSYPWSFDGVIVVDLPSKEAQTKTGNETELNKTGAKR